MSSRANRKRARRQRAAKAQEGRWYVWEPNRRAHPVSDIKAALLAYAARPRRPRPLVDALATLGERMPGVSQVTIATPVVSVTVAPKPAAPPPVCPHCGKP